MLLYATVNCNQDYNKFFYSNVCHICKAFGSSFEKNKLKACGGCKMIFYCCRDHQKVHWAMHKDFCMAVKDVREACTEELSAAQGEKARMKLLQQKVTSRLKRKLKIYEIQMFKYAKMCRYCGEANDELQDCSECLSVSFCKNHENKHEKDACSQYRKTFMSEMALTINKERFHWTYINFANSCHVDQDMEKFLKTFNDEQESEDEVMRLLYTMEQSRHFTRVLSIYKGLKTLGYKEDTEKLVFHCIGAIKDKEFRIEETFEVLFHLFPFLRFIQLVLIGPQLTGSCEITQKFLCIPCRREAKEFYIQYCEMTYCEYIEQQRNMVEADYIVGFNCRFHEYDIGEEEETWARSIKILGSSKIDKPVILTCHSQFEAKLTIERINLVLNKEIAYTYCEKNPFAALTSSREYEFEFEDDSTDKQLKEIDYYPVYYENEYLLTYKTLCQ